MSEALKNPSPITAAARRRHHAGVAKTAPLVILILGLLLAAFALSRSCIPGRDLNVDPQAQKEIEKARHR
jgi:hypothetical protein